MGIGHILNAIGVPLYAMPLVIALGLWFFWRYLCWRDDRELEREHGHFQRELKQLQKHLSDEQSSLKK